jgi:hypothetical protein
MWTSGNQFVLLVNNIASISVGAFGIRNAANSASFSAQSTTDLSDGNDHAVIGNYDPRRGVVEIWVDGTLEATVLAPSVNNVSATVPLAIGNYVDAPSLEFDGQMAEFRYGPALTPQEITACFAHADERYGIN